MEASGEAMPINQHLILAIRLLTAWKEFATIPMAEMWHGTPEDEQFMNVIMAYYHGLTMDDFASWTPEQVAYYKKHSFPYDAIQDRRSGYDRFIQALGVNETPEKRQLKTLISNFTEINHWWSVVSTRNHGGQEK